MGDLQVSSAVLGELRAAFRSMTGTLEGACRELRGVDSAAMGASPLADAVGSFTSSWQYGITQVGQHATEAVGMLDHIGKAFEECEQQLIAELRPKGGEGGTG